MNQSTKYALMAGGITIGLLMLFAVTITIAVTWPPHLRYDSSKSYELISAEFWADQEKLRLLTAGQPAPDSLYSQVVGNGLDWQIYCQERAAQWWQEAEEKGGGGWNVPQYIALAYYYLSAADIPPEAIGMDRKAIGIELFDFYVISFQTMYGAYRGVYTVPPPFDYKSMAGYLNAAGLDYQALGVTPDDWLILQKNY